jgi:thioredoxin reductase
MEADRAHYAKAGWQALGRSGSTACNRPGKHLNPDTGTAMPADGTYDVIVIGGGPAGLAAALWLARYRLRVRVFDAGNPRNEPTWAVHGYLGLEDPPPMELRRIGREQALRAGAEHSEASVRTVEGEKERFRITLEDDEEVMGRRILFATGLRDIIPEIPGLTDFYGSTIWHCPDCDGPTVEDLRVGVIGWGKQIASFCMQMLTWTDHLVILTHGHDPDLPAEAWEALERHRIPVRSEVLARIEGREGRVERVVFADQSTEEFDAIFFHIAYGPGSSLPAALGCEANEEGILKVDDDFETTVPGAYAAGDIVHGSKLAIRAAAEGTRAAVGIYRSLIPDDRRI